MHRAATPTPVIAMLVVLATFAVHHACTASTTTPVPEAPIYAGEDYTEQLTIETMPEGRLYSDFVFRSTLNHDTRNLTSFRLLSKPLGEVLGSYDIESLHLAFTNGRWDYSKWGFRAVDSQPGAQLAASFVGANDIDQKWKKLTYAMAGLFCASLNFMDGTNTVAPTVNLGKLGNFADRPFRYSTLPREAVCTENTTPWAKLLPCTTKTGLSTLLNAHRLFDSDFYSMVLSVNRICSTPSCQNYSWEIVQRLSVVHNLNRMSLQREWKLSTLFERSLDAVCPLSSNSEISIIGDASQTPLAKPFETVDFHGRQLHRYLAKDIVGQDLGMRIEDDDQKSVVTTIHRKCPLRLVRQLTGYGGIDGGILINIENYGNLFLNASLFSMLPWFVTPFIHTLKSNVIGSKMENVVREANYQPPVDRERPAAIELLVSIPPKSIISISMDFRKKLLQYTEYPPDANRGFDIASSILTIESQSGEDYYIEGESMYSYSHLLTMPTPDFSMPYNVITLTCTVVALFFGSAVNMLARNFVPISITNDQAKKVLLQ